MMLFLNIRFKIFYGHDASISLSAFKHKEKIEHRNIHASFLFIYFYRNIGLFQQIKHTVFTE